MAVKRRVSRTELVEILWRGGYPIFVPTYMRHYIVTLLAALAGIGFGIWLLETRENIINGVILVLFGGVLALYIFFAILTPSWRRLTIHKDHARTHLRKIPFKAVEQFEGGYPVHIRYKAEGNLGLVRNSLRLTKALPGRYVVGSYGLAHLLNRALDDYRARQEELVDESKEHH